MKKILILYALLTNICFAMGEYFVEDFKDNKNKWYTNTTKYEDVLIKDGNYVIKNLATESELSLVTSRPKTDFFANEYRMKVVGTEKSMYGFFIELDTSDVFYMIFSGNKIGYFYKKNEELTKLEDFEEFPYLFKDSYNSIILLSDNKNFTFLINELPIEKIWELKDTKIKKIGIYVNESTSIYLDKYTEYTL